MIIYIMITDDRNMIDLGNTDNDLDYAIIQNLLYNLPKELRFTNKLLFV